MRHSLVGEHAQKLLDEERIPVGSIDHERPYSLRERRGRELSDHSPGFDRWQRVEVDRLAAECVVIAGRAEQEQRAAQASVGIAE